MRAAWAFILLAVMAGVAARAQTLVATRPGLMCVSPAALARLTLPDGSSRALSPRARAEDGAIKQAGGCLDFSPGQAVTVLRVRRQTTLVTADLQDGKGPQHFIVPSIDFRPDQAPAALPAPATPPSSVAGESTRLLASTLGKACPAQGWTIQRLARSEHDPIAYVFYAMDRGQQRVAQDEAEANCARQGSVACVNETIFGVMIRAGHLPDMVRAACTQRAP